MIIEVLESAKQDLSDGAIFYENSEQGLGSYFLDSLFSDIDSLVIYAGVHEVYCFDLHRLLAKRFPFAIYYRKEKNRVRIYAVLDTRRKPAWIRGKLDRIQEPTTKYDETQNI